MPFTIGFAFIIVVVLAMVQISFFRALPPFAKRVLAYFPMLAIALNFSLSFVILFFTGTAYFIGPMNLAASVIFGLYITAYKKARGIHKVKRGRFKFPTLREEKPDGNWLF